jgi:hypothetical protein
LTLAAAADPIGFCILNEAASANLIEMGEFSSFVGRNLMFFLCGQSCFMEKLALFDLLTKLDHLTNGHTGFVFISYFLICQP